MKQGHKMLLFSTVILGGVVAGTGVVGADTISSDLPESSLATASVVTKTDQGFSEPEATSVAPAVTGLVLDTPADPVPSQMPSSVEDLSQKEVTAKGQDLPNKDDLVEDLPSSAVTVFLADSVATIHYERPVEEADTTILHSIWSKDKGKEDMKWLEATSTDTRVDLKKQGGYGSYYIDSYKATNGNLRLFNQTSLTYADPSANAEASKTPLVSVSSSVNDTTLTLQLKRDSSLADALIQYAIWSQDKGKDDLQWYVAWPLTTIDLSKHKGVGQYHLQTYAWIEDKPVRLTSSEFTYSPKMSEEEPLLEPKLFSKDGVYHFKSRVPIKEKVSLVETPVTYFDKGMSVYYDKRFKAQGHEWLSYVSYAGHRYYVDLGVSNKEKASKPVFETEATSFESSPMIAKSGTYHFTQRAGIKAEPKQSAKDLAYYDKGMSVHYDKVVRADGKKWLSYVSYAGNRRYIAIEKEQNKTQPLVKPATFAKVSLENVNAQAGTYDVLVTDVVAPDGLDFITIPTWTEKGGQDDIKWPHALKQADGSYRYTVKISDHQNEAGLYHSHVYLVTPDKQFQGLGALSVTMELPKKEDTNLAEPLKTRGAYIFKERTPIKAQAKVESPDLAYYEKGMSVNYDQTLIVDGHQWLSYISYAGNRRFVDLGLVLKKELAQPTKTPATEGENKDAAQGIVLPAVGTYTFTQRSGIKTAPKITAQDLAYYEKGMSVNYDQTVTADGKVWLSYLSYSGNRRYIAIAAAELDESKTSLQAQPVVKASDTNLLLARLAFAQRGYTSDVDVRVTDLKGKGTVHLAVWNGQKGQDDLRWYDMKRIGDQFIGSFDRSRHAGNGPLYMQAYYQEAPGAKMQFVRGLTL